MFWEEKIDALKKRFTSSEFRDPFREGPSILKKIEANFIIKKDLNYHLANWGDNLKNESFIRLISRHGIDPEIEKLEKEINYWIVVIAANNPTARQLVYDCRKNALKVIISIAPANFYIADKKYRWLACFKTGSNEDEIQLVKSGSARTPFD